MGREKDIIIDAVDCFTVRGHVLICQGLEKVFDHPYGSGDIGDKRGALDLYFVVGMVEMKNNLRCNNACKKVG